MGILNIDEHVEEHRLMAIRYPDKAVIPGQSVIAQSNIPFLIMPGDGAANGCQFTGTAGAFTLSAAILANIVTTLAGCYAYFSANFGGSSLPAGWYWTEFSSDTAGIVYAETYTSGTPRRPAIKTPITPNLSGWVTATTSEIVGPSKFSLPAGALGKNGNLQVLLGQAGSASGTKSFFCRAGSDGLVRTGTTVSPVVDSLHVISCVDSHSTKQCGRTNSASLTSIATAASSYVALNQISVDTSVDVLLDFSLQQSTNTATPVLLRAYAIATYGD